MVASQVILAYIMLIIVSMEHKINGRKREGKMEIRQLIYEISQFGNGWTAWDGESRDKIPHTDGIGKKDFVTARDCAVKAWGDSWAAAVEAEYDGSHTNG